MNKKGLMAIPSEEMPETEIPYKSQIYVRPWCGGGKGYYNTVTNYVYTAQSLECGVLMLNFFQSGRIVMRSFIDKESFFNQLFLEDKVSNAMIANTVVCNYNTALYPLNGADEIIAKHFEENLWYPEKMVTWREFPDGIKKVAGYQHTIRNRKREERYQKIRDSIDSSMLEIRPPVKGFDKWVFDHIMPHYIIYSAPSKEGICTHCHSTVQIKAAHGDDIRCPHCRHKVTVLRSGAFHSGPNRRTKERSVWYIQKLKNGIAMRLFDIHTHLNKNYKSDSFDTHKLEMKINDEWSMVTKISEIGRYFIDDAGTFQHSFEYGRFFNTNEVRWCRSNTMSGYCFKIYPAGADILKSVYTEFKYIPIKDIIRGRAYNPYYLMKDFSRYPFIEYTWKLKLKKLTYDLLDWRYCYINDCINTEGRNITEIFGVSKSDIKELVKLDPDIDDFQLFKLIKANNINASVDDIKSLQDSHSQGVEIIQCLKYQSLSKFVKYINTQAQLRGGEEHSKIWRYTLSDYCDYISDAETAGFNLDDTAVLNPYDLTAAHDDTDIEARITGYIEKGSIYAAALEQRAGELNWLCYENNSFIIRPIQTFNELIEESRQMRHCVGSYADKYAEGHCVILCVRRRDMPEKAFVTLELSKDFRKIIQLRGFKNSSVQEDVKKFCDEWLAMISKLNKSASAKTA